MWTVGKILLFLFIFPCDGHPGLPNNRINFTTLYDLVILAQSWPQTAYWKINNWPNSSASNIQDCKSIDGTSWMLHGLWPKQYDNAQYVTCEEFIKYDPTTFDDSFQETLARKWPSQYYFQTNNQFWRHQWAKHGICLSDVEGTSNQRKYFRKAVSLLDRFNAGVIYEKSELSPGHKYSVHEYLDAIKAYLGVQGRISCIDNPNSNSTDQYLLETIICLNKAYQPMNCTDNARKTKCSFKEDVIYPKMENFHE